MMALRRKGLAGVAWAAGLALLTVAPAAADCNIVPFRVSQPLVENFVLRPHTLLQQFPRGGEQLSSAVAVIASASRTALPVLARSAANADPNQKRSMIEGLSAAARLCEGRDIAHARRIESVVRRHPDPALREMFNAHYRSRLDAEAEARSKRVAEQMSRLAASRSSTGGNTLFNPTDPGTIGPLRSLAPQTAPLLNVAPAR